jgi:hypothetical protein
MKYDCPATYIVTGDIEVFRSCMETDVLAVGLALWQLHPPTVRSPPGPPELLVSTVYNRRPITGSRIIFFFINSIVIKWKKSFCQW